ncbi:hypothetical protein EJ05DRAFT_501041 [Pseudovirgaria hyperparasitica]|uniref:Uncharacterized protein n=1 Tax=Pseudovirgaria hyperparasitica TaxID=470096 RepID=A0A6A6W4M3_9PEZI|nr:uncharacterized protein EJ05DRAFT_501041 [Pseudovirgaria hyperparasitica]KAF2757505.1 hypothetical protein EJ05DRAFT_501041 [Pseudovirgaria hyperparasitica]
MFGVLWVASSWRFAGDLWGLANSTSRHPVIEDQWHTFKAQESWQLSRPQVRCSASTISTSVERHSGRWDVATPFSSSFGRYSQVSANPSGHLVSKSHSQHFREHLSTSNSRDNSVTSGRSSHGHQHGGFSSSLQLLSSYRSHSQCRCCHSEQSFNHHHHHSSEVDIPPTEPTSFDEISVNNIKSPTEVTASSLLLSSESGVSTLKSFQTSAHGFITQLLLSCHQCCLTVKSPIHTTTTNLLVLHLTVPLLLQGYSITRLLRSLVHSQSVPLTQRSATMLPKSLQPGLHQPASSEIAIELLHYAVISSPALISAIKALLRRIAAKTTSAHGFLNQIVWQLSCFTIRFSLVSIMEPRPIQLTASSINQPCY